MNTSKSAQACPDVVTYAANTVVTQFSTCPVHPACCGATHAVASPSFSCAVSSNASPGPIRSPGSHGSQARGQARQLRPQLLASPTGTNRAGPASGTALVPGRLGQGPAVRLHPRRQPRHVRERGPRAAPLRQDPAQHLPDLRIHPVRAPGHVTYAGLRGRVVLSLVTHQATRHGRPGFHGTWFSCPGWGHAWNSVSYSPSHRAAGGPPRTVTYGEATRHST